MPYTNYPNGFKNGLSVREIPLVITPNPQGDVYWVNSNSQNASDANGVRGTNQYPLATLAAALSRVVAGQGDIIMIGPGHTETITSAVSVDKSAVVIIGVGDNENRPVITFATSTAASLSIDAADVSLQNVVFKCNIASQVAMIDVNAARFHMNDCKLAEGTATGLVLVDVNGGAANACDGTQITNCELYAPTAGNYNAGIELGEVADNVQLKGNDIYGDWDDAGIHNPTGKVLTRLNIANNIVHNVQTADHAIELVSACTGNLSDNRLYADDSAATLDPGSLKCTANWAVNNIDEGGYIIPIDGTSFEYWALNTQTNVGSTFWIKKTVVSSTITFGSAVDITTVSTGGELAVEEVVLKTDATGLATGTNFELKSDNTDGAANFVVETVANLGANVTVDLSGASVTGVKTVIETGKKLQVQSTVADCTGAGEIDVYVKFSRLTAGATIAVT